MNKVSDALGTQKISKLIVKQAVPASIGILFMTVNLLIDTIFVGKWIGSIAIAALTVVTPVAFLIGSIGFAIGVGGSSVLSRALGEGKEKKAESAFAHQIMLTFLLSSVLVILGLVFSEQVLVLFGAKGKILEPAKLFYYPILFAAPLQALCAVGNSVIRAEDKARFSMVAMIVPSIANILLDILFIKFFNWGIFGAAMATAISFLLAFLFIVWFFIFRSELRLKPKHFIVDFNLTKEISALSLTTFSRQSVIGVLSVLLNHVLFENGGENSVTIYGIISKMLMFALFPVNGITEGFLPVAGYNYGAEKFKRVRESVIISIKYAGLLAILVYAVVLIFADQIVTVFTDDPEIIKQTPNALRWVFAASPVIALQLIGSAYFQAAGKALKSLLLTLTKQGFFLIPLILILPKYFGIFGVWIAFPIADVLATLVTTIFLVKEIKTKLSSS